MTPDDKKHKKRLKEAEKTYSKSMKAFKQGKMSKEDLKEKLRPYKYELKELGYPVKIKDDDRPKEEEKEKKEPSRAPAKISYSSWKKRSSLTIEEIEGRVDTLSFGGKPSDSLRRIYKEKYGEDLLPPENLVPFEPVREELPRRQVKGALPAASDNDLVTKGNEEEDRKPFWKSLFKGSKKEEQELEGSD